MNEASLKTQLVQLIGCFPEVQQRAFREAADSQAWEQLSGRYPGGPGRRWFAAVGGQEGEQLFYDGYTLLSLADAVERCERFDERREADPEYWVSKDWIAIAANQCGGHLMIDDGNGRVLVVHDDDADVEVLARSAEQWFGTLIAAFGAGTTVWRLSHGLVERAALARAREQLAAYEAAQRPSKRKLMGKLVLAALLWLLIWVAARALVH